MTISVECEGCQTVFKVGDHLAGKKIRCKHCSDVIAVPAEDSGDVADEDEEFEERPARMPRQKSKRPSRSGSSMPLAIILALTCLVGMMGLTVLDGLGSLFIGQDAAQRGGMIVGLAIRMLVEVVVFIGVLRGSSGTRVPSIVLALLFCVVGGLSGMAMASKSPPDERLFIYGEVVLQILLRLVYAGAVGMSSDYFEE